MPSSVCTVCGTAAAYAHHCMVSDGGYDPYDLAQVIDLHGGEYIKLVLTPGEYHASKPVKLGRGFQLSGENVTIEGVVFHGGLNFDMKDSQLRNCVFLPN